MSSSSALRCPNGSDGRILSFQRAVDNVSPSIQLVDCSNVSGNSNGNLRPTPTPQDVANLTNSTNHAKRQTNVCQSQCNTSCYNSGIQYNPDDCDSLSRWMWQRQAQFSIERHQRVVLSWGNCMYTFTSHHQEAVTWCDAEWAQIGTYIARPCLSGGSNGGGACEGADFLVQVLTNDGATNTPTPIPSASGPPESFGAASAGNFSEGFPPPPGPFRNGSSPFNHTMPFNGSGPFPADPNRQDTDTDTSQKGVIKIAVVPLALGLAGLFTAIIMAICAWIFWRRTKRKNRNGGMIKKRKLGNTNGTTFTYVKRQPGSLESVSSQKPMLSRISVASMPPPSPLHSAVPMIGVGTPASMTDNGGLLALPSTVTPGAAAVVGVGGVVGDPGDVITKESAIEEATTKEADDRPPTRTSTYTLDPDPFKAAGPTYPSNSPV